jgi:hypothetical protein
MAGAVDADACVIVITAINQKNEYESIDWYGTGGGPIASVHPPAKIYTSDGSACNATVFESQSNGFRAHEARDLEFTCFSGSFGIAKGMYDPHSDVHPARLVLNLGYFAKTELNLEQ